jgi:hypothetical protein
MIQDRGIKAKVLRYMVARRWFPQVEVDVLPEISISATRDKPVTDIDVLGLAPDSFGGFQKVLVDCKTRKNESPVARTLWLSGLMTQTRASQGICVLTRGRVEPDHRFYASRYGVLLLTEDEFDEYMLATGVSRDALVGSVGVFDTWEAFFSIAARYRTLASAVEFARRGYWQASDSSDACRSTIVQLTKDAAELDPKVEQHHAVFGAFVALFSHALSELVKTIFAGYLRPETKEKLAAALLLLLYGGREAYQFRNRIAKTLRKLQDPDRPPAELTLPHWEGFVQLVRQCLDAPLSTSHSPLIALEVGFSHLGDQARSVLLARELAREDPQAAKFALLAGEYLQKATNAPAELADSLSAKLLAIQEPPRQIVVAAPRSLDVSVSPTPT